MRLDRLRECFTLKPVVLVACMGSMLYAWAYTPLESDVDKELLKITIEQAYSSRALVSIANTYQLKVTRNESLRGEFEVNKNRLESNQSFLSISERSNELNLNKMDAPVSLIVNIANRIIDDGDIYDKETLISLNEKAHDFETMLNVYNVVLDLKTKNQHKLNNMLIIYLFFMSILFSFLSWKEGVDSIVKFKDNNDLLKLDAIVFNHSSDGILTTDEKGKILSVNDRIEDLTGHSIGSVKGSHIYDFMSSLTKDDAIDNEMLISSASNGMWTGSIDCASDPYKSISVGVRAVFSDDSNITNYIIMMSDITKQKDAEYKFKQLSLHDQLTGLLNRNALIEKFDTISKIAKREGRSISVMMIDLDGFKAVNDTHGHECGDYVLESVAINMKSAIRDTDFLARTGGDEFVILSMSQSDDHRAEVETLSIKVIRILTDKIFWNETEINIGASIGCSIEKSKNEPKLKNMLSIADTKMYEVKKNGKNNFII